MHRIAITIGWRCFTCSALSPSSPAALPQLIPETAESISCMYIKVHTFINLWCEILKTHFFIFLFHIFIKWQIWQIWQPTDLLKVFSEVMSCCCTISYTIDMSYIFIFISSFGIPALPEFLSIFAQQCFMQIVGKTHSFLFFYPPGDAFCIIVYLYNNFER